MRLSWSGVADIGEGSGDVTPAERVFCTTGSIRGS
jgi:hypothetical protein